MKKRGWSLALGASALAIAGVVGVMGGMRERAQDSEARAERAAPQAWHQGWDVPGHGDEAAGPAPACGPASPAACAPGSPTTEPASAPARSLAKALGAAPPTQAVGGTLPPPLTGEARAAVLDAAGALTLGLPGDPQAAIDTLSAAGDQALVTLADELRLGNVPDQDATALQRRLALVDALGKASRASPLALALLEDFIGQPLDAAKPRAALHADVLDRLEAFEFAAAVDPAFAARFLATLPPGGRLRQKYLRHLIIGFKLAGLDEPAAVNRAYGLAARSTP